MPEVSRGGLKYNLVHMTVVFDGKAWAGKIENGVKRKVKRLTKKLGRKPRLVSLCNPEDPTGRFYTNIKMNKAKELGVEFVAYDLKSTIDWEGLVANLNKDSRADGLMLQLPLTTDRSRDIKLCLLIDPGKDADGLNPRSGVVPAAVRAVLAIVSQAIKTVKLKVEGLQVAVVGSEGMVGRPLLRELKKDQRLLVYGMDKYDFDANILRQADVVISCTGQERLIRPELVKEGVIAIDVGYPHGDFDPEVAGKSNFFTPVPGGVGPVTVAMLFANLVKLKDGGNEPGREKKL
jgi:methylenetetrahydrofolate dehydrogenase (NADP+)/methenyltetrahydrofolate cyclohydrolase